MNVSELKNAAQTGQGRERVEVKGGKNHTGQSTVKDSQVKESQKGRGDINTLVLHLRAFQTMKEMLKKSDDGSLPLLATFLLLHLCFDTN